MGRRRRLLGKKSNTVLTAAPAPAAPPEAPAAPEAEPAAGPPAETAPAETAPAEAAAPPAVTPPPEPPPPEPPRAEDPGVAGLEGAVGVPESLPGAPSELEQPSGFADTVPSAPAGSPDPMAGMGFDPLGDALMGGASGPPEPPSPPRDSAEPSAAQGTDDGSDWVSEAEYSTGTHQAPPVDTTDEGWNEPDSGHHRPPPTPTGPPVDVGGGDGSGLLDKLKGGGGGDPADYTAPAGPPVSTPEMPLFGDDVLGPGESAGLMGSANPAGDFTADEPPTEEVPSAVLQDLSQLYNAPMDVPQPPPMPGIFDDPAMGGPIGGPPPLGGAIGQPQGDPFRSSPEPSTGSQPFAQPEAPRPGLPTTQPPDRPISYDEEDDDEWEDEDSDEDEAPFGLSRTAFLAVAGGISVLAAMIIVGTVIVLTAGGFAAGGGGETPTDAGATPPTDTPPVAAPADTPTDRPPVDGPEGPEGEGEGEGDDTDAQADDTDDQAKEPEPPPVSKKKKPPVRTQVTKKKVVEPPPPKRDTTGKGTLKVRSNKRVLVMVDGRPVDFSPLELPLAVGVHTISAMQPGRRDTKQDKEVTIEGGTVSDIEFTF